MSAAAGRGGATQCLRATLQRVGRPPAAKVAQAVLAFFTLGPALYFVLVTQYGALTYPFWDHVELAHLMVRYFEDTWTVSELFRPHNDSRPFTYRALYLANASLTDWDIRSEFVVMLAVGLSTWLLHLRRIRQQAGHTPPALAAAAIVSVVVFSPVAHSTHWWSFMLPFTLANLLLVAAVLLVTCGPHSLRRHVAAVALAWLAAYTLIEAIMLFAVMAVVMQLTAPEPRRADRLAVLWAANLGVLLLAYFAGGLPNVGSIFTALWAAVSYLGAPVAWLLFFPMDSQFRVPGTAWSGAFGIVMVLLVATALHNAWPEARRRTPVPLTFAVFATLGVAMALFAAWRLSAHGLDGAAAGAARYSVFSSYVLIGLVYYMLSSPPNVSFFGAALARFSKSRATHAAVAAFLLLSAVTYVSALKVYRQAHDFNWTLGASFRSPATAHAVDQFVYPDPAVVAALKASLQRLGVGPYRARAQGAVLLGSAAMIDALQLQRGSTFTQRFRLLRPGATVLSFKLVTYGQVPAAYEIEWELRSAREQTVVTRGRVNTAGLRDWQPVDIHPQVPLTAGDFELVVSVPPGAPVASAAGIPLYRGSPSALAVPVGGNARVLGLTIVFGAN